MRSRLRSPVLKRRGDRTVLMDNLLLALASIRANRLRSALTVLGVLVGVFSVTLIVALGRAVEREVSGSLEALGANMVFVFPATDAATTDELVERDASTIETRIPSVLQSSVLISANVRALAGDVNVDTTLRGVSGSYFEVTRLVVEDGAPFSDSDVRSGANVAVLGKSVADRLFDGEPAIGRRIRLNGVASTVGGVVTSPGASAAGDPNDFILVPITTARQRYGIGRDASSRAVDMIIVELPDEEGLEDARSQILALLKSEKRLRDDVLLPFNTATTEEISNATSTVITLIQWFLAAIASVSIFVGSIGITNIMLVTVAERTKEIGIRMAVGATEKNIRDQFLTESAVLCAIGGMSGVLVAGLVATVIGLLAKIQVPILPVHVLTAFLVSIAIGLVAGFVPSRKAARLDPIEALRRE